MLTQALALLEVRGLGVAIEVADAMAKSAPVRLYPPVRTDPGLITLLACGDHGACTAALTAGRLHAQRLHALVSERLLGRPDPGLGHFFGATLVPPEHPYAPHPPRSTGAQPDTTAVAAAPITQSRRATAVTPPSASPRRPRKNRK